MAEEGNGQCSENREQAPDQDKKGVQPSASMETCFSSFDRDGYEH